MRGVSFKINNGTDKVLSKIFYNIDISNYTWNISEDEIYLFKSNLPLFQTEIVDGKEFYNLINQNKYLVICANIRANFQKGQIQEFHTYDEFFHSSCEINLFCTDVDFYEVYIKNQLIIEAVKKNCIENAFSDIEYITDESDQRTRFTIS